MRIPQILQAAVLAFAAASTQAAITTTVSNVPIASGTVRVITYRPDTPVANLIIMYGGDGVLRFIPPDGGAPDGVVLRFVEGGSSVTFVDVPVALQAQGGGYTLADRST